SATQKADKKSAYRHLRHRSGGHADGRGYTEPRGERCSSRRDGRDFAQFQNGMRRTNVGPRGRHIAPGTASPSSPFLYCSVWIVRLQEMHVTKNNHFLRAAIEKWAGWGGSNVGGSALRRPA